MHTRRFAFSVVQDCSFVVVLILERAWPVCSGCEIKCFCCIAGTTIIYSVHVQRHFHVRGMVLQIRLQITGYHHVDILPPHRKFLGFSWTLADEKKWFVLSVLPFGLASTPYVFTRIQKAIVKYWREQDIRIFTVYLPIWMMGQHPGEVERSLQPVVLSLILKNVAGNQPKKEICSVLSST